VTLAHLGIWWMTVGGRNHIWDAWLAQCLCEAFALRPRAMFTSVKETGAGPSAPALRSRQSHAMAHHTESLLMAQ
jgi:hypothetical protein